ncbi:DUF3159 domain-containing protein [Saccharopolyspora phatthalungensis]|nr:DUF3159 domain-containing protein [Saccharopolyspora phatthalungensis]
MPEHGRNSGETPHAAELAPKPTLLDQMGGPSGLVYTGLPVVVFVVANSVFGLQGGIWSAIGIAVAITVLRLVRKEPIRPAVSGLIGVGVAAFIAYQTGSAKGFFLVGIWASLLIGSVLLVSVLVRWPLVGVAVNLFGDKGNAWRRDRPSRHDYDIATLALVSVFAARFVVQQWLYNEDNTGWLAFAKIAMGYPLLGLALLVVVWAARRSTKRLKALD